MVPLELLKLEEKIASKSDPQEEKMDVDQKPTISNEPELDEPLPTRTVTIEKIEPAAPAPIIKRTVSIIPSSKVRLDLNILFVFCKCK